MAEPGTLGELARVFFRLGCLAFGGPAAHIALLEEEVVRKRQWVTPAHFLDLIGATNLIPGPNSTEMTMHVGHERAGWKGLLVAGSCFILPAVVITGALAWLYERYGQLPQLRPFLYGTQPAVLSIILSAAVSLGKKAVKTTELGLLGTATVLAVLAGVNEIVALFACGGAGVLLYLLRTTGRPGGLSFLLLLQAQPITGSGSIWATLLTFLKIGSLLYGSGYVLIAFLEAELVSPGLLTRAQLIDAVAVGQFTPGPVLSTATFIGWQLQGFWGAVAATVGIFAPSFGLVALLNPLIPRLRRSALLSAFLDTVNVASVGVIAAVGLTMGRETLNDWRTALIAGLGVLVTQVVPRINSAWVVIGGALLGYLLTRI